MKKHYLLFFIFYCSLHNVAKAQWYSSKTNNNIVYNDSTAKRAIWALHDSLQRGKLFKDIAFKYSQDPTSYSEGGELPPTVIDEYVKEYQDVIRYLVEGQTSKPFKSEYGYNIIQLLSKEKYKCVVRSILLRTD